MLNLEDGHKSGHTCTLSKKVRTHTGVGSINSFVASEEEVFKILFFQFCQGIVKLTDSQLGTDCLRGDEFWDRAQVSKPAQNTCSVYCIQVVKSSILCHSRFG